MILDAVPAQRRVPPIIDDSLFLFTVGGPILLAPSAPPCSPDGDVLDQSIKKSAYYIPVETWENRQMNVANLQPFDSMIWYHRHGTQKPSDKVDSRGAKGRLIGQIASNISLVWTENDRIQRVADRHIDYGEVSLSEARKSVFTENDKSEASPATSSGTSDEEGNQEGGVELRPARGFAAFIGASSPSKNKIPRPYTEAMRRPDRAKWFAAMEREMEKLNNKNVWDLVRIDDTTRYLGVPRSMGI